MWMCQWWISTNKTNQQGVKQLNKFWDFKNVTEAGADLYIYGEIDSFEWDDTITSANKFKAELDAIGDVKKINLYINSVGGSVFQGLSIGNMIKRHNAKVTCHIDGLAASIASVIATSCDKVVMPKNAMMMIHNALCGVVGNAQELRKMADDLDKMTASLRQTYLQKAGDKLDEAKLIELMDAETWLSADDCLALGLCDKVIESNKMAAKVDLTTIKNYKNVPDTLKNDVDADELDLIKCQLDLI